MILHIDRRDIRSGPSHAWQSHIAAAIIISGHDSTAAPRCQSGVITAYVINAGPGAAAGASKGPAVKQGLPADSLEAFASNKKLREQLEEVRSTVASAKAQVEAAEDVPRAQVCLQTSADSRCLATTDLAAASALQSGRVGCPFMPCKQVKAESNRSECPANCVSLPGTADYVCWPS